MSDLVLQTTMRDLCWVVFKRKWSALTIVTVTVISTLVWVVLIRDNIYEVRGKVLVKIGQEHAVPPTVLGSRPMMIVGQRFQDVNTEVDVLTSTDLLGRLVDELGLDKPGPPEPVPPTLIGKARYYAKHIVKSVRTWKNEILIKLGFRVRLTPREEAIAMLQKGLLVTPQKDSNVLVVRLFIPTRQFASAILNSLLDLYCDFRLDLFYDNTALGFFEAEVATARAALGDAERLLGEFEQTHNFRSIEEQKTRLLAQIAEARSAYKGDEIAWKQAEWKVAQLGSDDSMERLDFASLGSFERDSFIDRLMIKLSELRQQQEVLEMAPAANAERLDSNRRQSTLVLRMIRNNLVADAEAKRRVFDARQAEHAALTTELNDLHRDEQEWVDLRREANVRENTYLFYQTKLKESSATAAMEMQKIGNIKIIERGIDPLKPAGMRKLIIMLMAIGVALVSALAWISVLEFFDHRVYDTKTIEGRLGAPVIATVPTLRGSPDRVWDREKTICPR